MKHGRILPRVATENWRCDLADGVRGNGGVVEELSLYRCVSMESKGIRIRCGINAQ